MILTFEGSSAVELRTKVADFVMCFGIVPSPTQVQSDSGLVRNIMSTQPTASGTVELSDSVKKSRVKKAKETSAVELTATVESTEVVDTATVETAVNLPACTRESVLAALQTINTKKGINAAREILSEFQASRVSEIKEADFERFIATCNAKAAG